MPYLQYEEKEKLLDHMYPVKPGELNFLLSVLMIRYWQKSKRNYQALNDISGAATEALAEFRRNVVVPYELRKMAENGNIYEGVNG